MATDLLTRITAEIKQLERQVDAQKRVIKKSAGKASAIEQAETELKALRTRLAVLEENRRKLANEETGLA